MQENDLRESVLSKEYFRRKTGQIVSSIVAETKGLHVEFLRRQYSATARSLWHVRQPRLVRPAARGLHRFLNISLTSKQKWAEQMQSFRL